MANRVFFFLSLHVARCRRDLEEQARCRRDFEEQAHCRRDLEDQVTSMALVASGISRTRSPPWRSLPFCSSPPAPKRKLLIVGVAAVSGVLLLGAIFGCCCFWRKKRQAKTAPSSHGDVIPMRLRKRPAASPARNQWLEENKMGSELDFDLPFFDLEVILTATDDFTPDSKIRQGGFRSVYMGKLEDGQEVNVSWSAIKGRCMNTLCLQPV